MNENNQPQSQQTPESAPKIESMRFTSSTQNGKPGHCYAAQVFGPDGKSVAVIEPTQDPTDASVIAAVCASALNYWNDLKKLKL